MNFLTKVKQSSEISMKRGAIRRDDKKLHHSIITLLSIALLITLLLELLNRRSVDKLIMFIYESPLIFLLNAYLVLNTLSFSMFFKRRKATLISISLLWLLLGVVNFVVISYRTQPFTIADVMLVKDMFSLISVYFTWYQIILIFGGLIGLVALIVLMFIKLAKRERVPYFATFITLTVMTALSFGFVKLYIYAGYIAERGLSLKDAYQSDGFAYTFIDTFADMGISRPEEYSKDAVDGIVVKYIGSDTPVEKENPVVPNIVYVQLESFFDYATLADNITFSENPTPNYHALLESYPSGRLYVPVVGGGTANTEFEMLTGMNLDFFGAGEYPYYTVLRDTPCETICYVLNRLGYTSTAVHNYMASFYGRNGVYSRLGFNRFESMEYMDDLKYGEIGWAKDDAITDSVIDAMNTTPARDFVMAITVSTHGKYSADTLLKCAETGIQVNSAGDYFNAIQLQNFTNLAKGMDDWLATFIKAMSDYDEPVICVFYGDHLPALDWDSACLDSGNLFETQYVIWNNYGARFDAPDIQAYQLSANLLKQLGIEDGVIFRYHQQNSSHDEGIGYLTELEILEYDMLYGDLEVFSGENPFVPTELKMGIDDIKITTAEYSYGRLLVKGDGFNEFSALVIDDTPLETVYIDKNTLAAQIAELPPDAVSLSVAQISNEDVNLSSSSPYNMSAVTVN